MAESISDKPWSDYTKADYSMEQWHRACLICQHAPGMMTSKDQCKLPVRTPMGVLNRNGIHAAAAALAGARGGVDATDAEKKAAKSKLVRLYAKLNEEAPDSLKHDDLKAVLDETRTAKVKDYLAHFGVKGMHWGVRRSRGPSGTVTGTSEKKTEPESEAPKKDVHVSVDAERFIRTHQKEGVEMSDREIREAINRANMVRDYDKIFGKDPNGQLQAQVNNLALQKQYRDLQRELNPPRVGLVTKFAKSADSSFSAYERLDKATDGALKKEVGKRIAKMLEKAAEREVAAVI